MKIILTCILASFWITIQSQLIIHIKDVSILSLEEGKIISNQDVIINDGKILAIFPTVEFPSDPGTRIVDGKGLYLMPGLSEMHAHIPVPQDDDDTYVRETLFLYLANGVTLIRGMLGQPYHLELKKEVEKGKILSPRIYTSSPSLNGNSIPTKEDAKRNVQQYASEGYDFLKIHPGIRLDVFKEVVNTAIQSSIRFAGHVPVDVGVRRAIDFGYWSIDHLDGYIEALVLDEELTGQGGFFGYQFTGIVDRELIPELARHSAERKIWQVPTMSLFTRWFSPVPASDMIREDEMAYIPARLRYSWVNNKEMLTGSQNYDANQYHEFIQLRNSILRALYNSGAPLLLGSDSPQVMNVPGFSIHHEIEAMLDAGIPIKEVLRSGTIHPARFFGQEDVYGKIVIGADADIILLKGNPLENHHVLKRPEAVMIQGQWLDRAFLDKELEIIKQRHLSE
ncbi:MAG TPA: amidohydrolase family protein [Saprospiraceae bacterium]|nr:amidohydrolase family protein [Saprospiraceae bacterium]